MLPETYTLHARPHTEKPALSPPHAGLVCHRCPVPLSPALSSAAATTDWGMPLPRICRSLPLALSAAACFAPQLCPRSVCDEYVKPGARRSNSLPCALSVSVSLSLSLSVSLSLSLSLSLSSLARAIAVSLALSPLSSHSHSLSRARAISLTRDD